MDTQLPDLATALAQMPAAVGSMGADDILIEFDAEQSGSRSKVRLRFRAYRRRE